LKPNKPTLQKSGLAQSKLKNTIKTKTHVKALFFFFQRLINKNLTLLSFKPYRLSINNGCITFQVTDTTLGIDPT
jgi:hypothetical protein